ncbi:MAG: S9 family peptidase, partial [Acidobacteriota bacterium]|nr:S9 family peptidase [Acidobacteriota bacterium]
MTKRLALRLSLGLIVLALAAAFGAAQEPYKLPPQNVQDILNAPPTPRVTLSPDREVMLLVENESMPTIAYISQPLLRLAGMRITPANNSGQVLTFSTGLTLKTIKTGLERKIDLPAGIKFSGASWSDDGKWIAFARYLDDGVELWVVDAVSGRAKALTAPRLNMVTGDIAWMPGDKQILCSMVPGDRGPAPVEPRIPIGPTVQVSGGKQTKVATMQDLLKSPSDETLFDYYATGQLVEVDVPTGQVKSIGKPGIYASVEPSPDGAYLLVERIKRPYSYSVAYY